MPFLFSHYICISCCMYTKSLQLCPTLCDPVDCNAPVSSVYRILYTRIPEWVAMPFPRGSSQSRDQTHRIVCLLHSLPQALSGKPCISSYLQPENILYWHFVSSLRAENHIIQRRSRTPTWKPSLIVNVALMTWVTWGNMGAVSSAFATCSEFSTLLSNSFLIGDSRECLWGLTPKWYFQVLSLGIWKWNLYGNKVFADIIKLGILNKVILNLGLAPNLMTL